MPSLRHESFYLRRYPNKTKAIFRHDHIRAYLSFKTGCSTLSRLVFPGTKANVEEESEQHRYNASLLIKGGNKKVLIDYGLRHPEALDRLSPDAVLITHAHPDHYIWTVKDLKSDIPVYATKETLEYAKYKPDNYKVVRPGTGFYLGSFSITAYRVIHSILCPAVGYKIVTPEGKKVAYNPDLMDIEEKESVLRDLDYYIGDGSSIQANLVRRKGDQLYGHARITTQINWFENSHTRLIFTHLGKETMRREEELKSKYPDITLAYDGMEVKIDA